MKIAMVQDDWWPRIGGGPIHVRELSLALAEHHECTVDIFTRALKQDGERHDREEQLLNGKVIVHRLGPTTGYWNPLGRGLSMVTPLPHLLRGKYDIVHGHTYMPAISTQLSGGLSGNRTVFTVHGTALTTGVGRDETALAGLKRQIEKGLILQLSYDAVISVNAEHVPLLERYHDEVHSIPNGINLGRFSGNAERTQDIIFIGRLAPVKRVSDLLEAFGEVMSEFPNSTLRIVGTGPKLQELERQAIKLGISDRVSFEGSVPREKVTKYYASAGAFVLPSIREGHPLTLLEAWASGTPVIATSVEGIEEFVDHERTGYLVPPKSPAKLADALRFVLENPEVADKWRQNAHNLVKMEYSWERIANRTYGVYQGLV